MSKIIDAFCFFNELDLLRLRLLELQGVVDSFILVEAAQTHSGNKKPLYFEKYRSEFVEFADKIIHVVVDELPRPIAGDRWPLYQHQLEAIKTGLKTACADPEDIVLISDVDEIPRAAKVLELPALLSKNPEIVLLQDFYEHYLNCKLRKPWCGTVAVRARQALSRSIFNLRTEKKRAGRIFKQKYLKRHKYLPSAGWHFSSFGGPLSLLYKCQSFAHREADKSGELAIPPIASDVCRNNLHNHSAFRQSEILQHMQQHGIFALQDAEHVVSEKLIEWESLPASLLNNREEFEHFVYRDNPLSDFETDLSVFESLHAQKPPLWKRMFSSTTARLKLESRAE